MAGLEGQTFAGYEVIAKIGQGGMGAVYKARQPMLNRFVALKVLFDHLAQDPDYIARFQREAVAAGALSHPGIVQLYAAGECEGRHYIAMEFVEGETLKQRLERSSGMETLAALDVCLAVAKALNYAWQKSRLIHRDIKPDNIFLSNNGEVKLGDLGIARRAGSTTGLTIAGMAVGTPHYVSPEQARGQADIDFRADIYSLGCTLYHMLTGRPPYDAADPLLVVARHVNDPPPAILKVMPTCPMPLVFLLGKMLAKHPNARHSSYADLIGDLSHLHEMLRQGGDPGSAPMPRTQRMERQRIPTPVRPSTSDLPGTDRRFSPVLVNIIAAVALLVIITGIIEWAPWQSPSPPMPHGTMQPVDDEFIRMASLLRPEGQVQRVLQKLRELNRGYDGKGVHMVEHGDVTELWLPTEAVTDISPLRALPKLERLRLGQWHSQGLLTDLSPLQGLGLKQLRVPGTQVSDLAPLQGMPLTVLDCTDTKVQDLSPLRGPASAGLQELRCSGTKVADLSPLRGMPLQVLACDRTAVRYFSPLKGMPLKSLLCDAAVAFDASNAAVLRSLPALETINGTPVAAFWQQQQPASAGSEPIGNAIARSSFEAFMKEIAALSADNQARRVITKLQELNPGFNSTTARYKLANGRVTELSFSSQHVTDISPVRALVALQRLECRGPQDQPTLADLSPLRGLALTSLDVGSTLIRDLSPLQGMPLRDLNCSRTQVGDLTPLRGMRLTGLGCEHTQVRDLSLLQGMPLRQLYCDFDPARDTEILRSIKTLERINGTPAAEFWKKNP